MKKSLLFLAAGSVLLVSSCNSKPDEFKQSINYPAINLITNIETGSSYISPGTYNCNFNVTDGTVIISSDNLLLNTATSSFRSLETPYTSRLYDMSNISATGTMGTIISINDVFATVNGTYPVENAKFLITNTGYFSNTVIKDYPYQALAPLLTQYNIDEEWLVRTFSSDAFYKGSTTTQFSMGGEPSTFTTSDILYRVIVDVAKSKATLILYDAKFAENMPVTIAAIIVEGLDFKASSEGYTITGANIVPSMLEGNGTTPAPEYTFTSVKISNTSNDLTTATIDYEINFRGMIPYYGTFTGRYLWLPDGM